jgi:hypothetical protein
MGKNKKRLSFVFFLRLNFKKDYAKFDKVQEDGSGVRDKESSNLSKKPAWALMVEKKDVVKLRQLIEGGELDLSCKWTGERHRWQTPGNFQDESETGTYTPLGYAVCWNKPEVVELMLSCGADPATPIVVNKVEVE